jgi:CheY-like chemotaxis protein
MHGGFIAAQSEGEGHGTEFYIDLPLVKQAKYTKSGKLRGSMLAIEPGELENIMEEAIHNVEEGEEFEDADEACIDEMIKKQHQPHGGSSKKRSGKFTPRGRISDQLEAIENPPPTSGTSSLETSLKQEVGKENNSQQQLAPNINSPTERRPASWWEGTIRVFGWGKHTKIYSDVPLKETATGSGSSQESASKGTTGINNFLNYPVQMLARKLSQKNMSSNNSAHTSNEEEHMLEEENSTTEFVQQYHPEARFHDIENQNLQTDCYNPVTSHSTTTTREDNTVLYRSSVYNPEDNNSNANQFNLKVQPVAEDMKKKGNAAPELAKISPTRDPSKSSEAEELIQHISMKSSKPQIRPKPDWNKGVEILLVDDADSNRKMCRRFLTAQKHNVTEAKDGLDCLRVYDEAIKGLPKGQEPFDLILMDDNMPNLLGYETAKKLRERGFKGIIIGVTGDIYPENIERFTSNGANDVLGKPLNVPKLKERFIQLIG